MESWRQMPMLDTIDLIMRWQSRPLVLLRTRYEAKASHSFRALWLKIYDSPIFRPHRRTWVCLQPTIQDFRHLFITRMLYLASSIMTSGHCNLRTRLHMEVCLSSMLAQDVRILPRQFPASHLLIRNPLDLVLLQTCTSSLDDPISKAQIRTQSDTSCMSSNDILLDLKIASKSYILSLDFINEV